MKKNKKFLLLLLIASLFCNVLLMTTNYVEKHKKQTFVENQLHVYFNYIFEYSNVLNQMLENDNYKENITLINQYSDSIYLGTLSTKHFVKDKPNSLISSQFGMADYIKKLTGYINITNEDKINIRMLSEVNSELKELYNAYSQHILNQDKKPSETEKQLFEIVKASSEKLEKLMTF
ncbi:hypothetical protein [Sporosarcina sp. FA9]|uniref:hypothetical protein n=1 Tax=Sporosarcina sp. FA9 TaxID=3413030 RepID=UPI003F6567C5